MRTSYVPFRKTGRGLFEHPYLDRKAKKKKAHFSRIVDFFAGWSATTGKARETLDRSGSCRIYQDVSPLLHANAFRKGQNRRIRKKSPLFESTLHPTRPRFLASM